MRALDWLYLAIGVAGLGLVYAGVARAAGWWPFERRRRAPELQPPPSRGEAAPPRGRGDAWFNRGTTLAGLVLSYLALALAADWPPFEPPAKSPVRIDIAASRFHPRDGRNAALEYVCLVNKTDESLDLQGWVLRDSHRDVNVLPEFVLPPRGHVRVHPGRGQTSPTDLYGDRGSAVWTDTGDTVTLLDRDGHEIDSRSYPARPQNDATATCG